MRSDRCRSATVNSRRHCARFAHGATRLGAPRRLVSFLVRHCWCEPMYPKKSRSREVKLLSFASSQNKNAKARSGSLAVRRRFHCDVAALAARIDVPREQRTARRRTIHQSSPPHAALRRDTRYICLCTRVILRQKKNK